MSCLEKKCAEIEDDVNMESVNNIKVVKEVRNCEGEDEEAYATIASHFFFIKRTYFFG